MKRVIIGITGASGAAFGVRLLHILRSVPDVETHLVVSASARLTLASECDISPSDLEAIAGAVHHPSDIAAPISSGSFRVYGMIIAPCSMKTMSNIATGNTGDLISRSADVVMKERRRLLLAVRETPLHAGHLANLLNLAQRGVTIFPPVPAFYHRPVSIQDIVDQSCMRMLDQLDIEVKVAPRWGKDVFLRRTRSHLQSASNAEDANDFLKRFDVDGKRK
jgi:4-hydroxy-3-polyprenylbenzoate decarboxylase